MTTHYADALKNRLVAQGLTVDRKHPATTNVRARWLTSAASAPAFATSAVTSWVGQGRVGMSTIAELVPVR